MSISQAPQGLRVPFLDLVAQHEPLETELVEVFRRAIRSAAFVGGAEVAGFEKEFASYCGTAESAAVNSGTDALRFAFLAEKIKPGDEVITVPNTFIATTEAITQAGGRIRFVDVDDETMNMDPAALADAIGPRTVGIVPVHLFGQCADMDPILKLAARHGLWVIEDACQAHGATYKGKTAGSIGALGAFSFYPGKNLGACGEGGAVTGSDAALLGSIRQLRDHGQAKKYYHDTEGYNGRLDAIQCGLLRVKLRKLPQWIEARRRVAAAYREGLDDVSEVRLPTEASYGKHVYHLFVIRVPDRERLQEHLNAAGVSTGLHYPLPLHLQKAYAPLGHHRGDFPVTEGAADHLLSLPMYAELTDAQIGHVVDSVRSFYGR